MRRLALILLACAVGVGLLFVYLSWFITEIGVRSAVSGRIEALTGYAVDVRGGTSVSVFPTPRFDIRNVVLLPPAGAATAGTDPSGAPKAEDIDTPAAEIASIDVLRGSVDVLPLLLGRIAVTDFTLVRPRLTLTEDRHGNANWTVTRQGDVGANVGEQTANAAAIEDVQIGSFRIEDGAITHIDRRDGTREEISAINATVAWPRLADRLEAGGSLVWNGEIVGFRIEANSPLEFLRHGSTRSRLLLQSGVVNATFDGNAHFTADPQLEGQITLNAPSTRALLRWIGSDVGTRPGPGLNALDLSGVLNFLPGSIALSDVALRLDENEAEGGVEINFGRKVRELQGTLAFETLDLGKYRSVAPAGDDTAPAPAAFLSVPVDLSPLDNIAVDLRLSAGAVALGDLQLGRSAGTVTVRNGTLDIGVGEATLYGGTAQGTITAKPAEAGARIKATLKFDKTDIGPLLQAMSGAAPITGATSARVSLAGTGATAGEIVADLSGEGQVKITNGGLAGIDVVALLDMLRAGRVEGWPSSPAATEFTELTASFVVTGGSAATDDFHMVGPNIEVSADGEIRLVSASVAGHGTADLRNSTGGTANGVEPDQLSVPFVIEGPIARPSIYPDPVWLLNRASASPEEIERARQELKQKTPEEIVDDLLTRGVGPSKSLNDRSAAPQQ